VALDVVRSKTFLEMQRPDATTIVASDVLSKLQAEFNTNLIVSVSVTSIFSQ